MAKIFIGYSGRHTEQIARKVYEILTNLSRSFDLAFKASDVFLACYDGNDKIDDVKVRLDSNLKDAEVYIPIISGEKLYSAWMMYELGAVVVNRLEIKGNGSLVNTRVIPFLVDIDDIRKIDDPLRQFHLGFEFQQKDQGSENYRKYSDFFRKIVESCSGVSDKLVTFDNQLGNYWEEFKLKLNRTVDVIKERKKKLRTEVNFDFNVTYFTSEEIGKYTPTTLGTLFREFVDNGIGNKLEEYIKKDNEGHYVVMSGDNVRISTFVVFTDKKNVLLFDRKKAKNEINVDNPVYDVFGSLDFENSSIQKKIKNTDFLNSPILEIKPIYGIAGEYNIDKDERGRVLSHETVIMLGVFAYMSEENLKLGENFNDGKKNSALRVVGIKEVNNGYGENALTSKAYLSIKQLNELHVVKK